MHARLADENEPDPLDVFCDLATLILEARFPGRGDSRRGYGEGPHCPPYFSSSSSNNNNNNNGSGGQLDHICSADKLHCQRFQSLRRHACLLGKNGLPLCVEVRKTIRNLCMACRWTVSIFMIGHHQVLIGPECSHGSQRAKQVEMTCTPDPDFLLLERWTVTCSPKK